MAGGSTGSGQVLIVTCIRRDGVDPIPAGTGIRLIDRRRTFITVYDQAFEIGHVSPEYTRILRGALAIQRRGGQSIAATVIGENEGDTFYAQLSL